MTVKQLKDCINEIPRKFDGKIIEVGGDLISEHVSNFNISWMDCSDGFLLFIEKNITRRNKMEMINFLEETKECLKENGKTLSDIQFVACSQGAIDVGTFTQLADREYDNGFGGPEVLESLVIVGDEWWLERHEYDGSEWWEYKERPKMPDKVWEDPHLFYEDYGTYCPF